MLGLSIPKGILTVQLLDASLEHNTSLITKMCPSVTLKLTTQVQRSKQLVGKTPTFDEQLRFYVNSLSIGEGRILELTVWDRGVIDKEVGYGIVDADPIIFNQLTNSFQKCYLTYQR
jgi:hypothetical protein